MAIARGFFDQGMDSLLAMELKRRIEAALGVALPSTLTFDHPTVDTLGRFLLDACVDQSAAAAAPRGPAANPDITTAEQLADDIRKMTTRQLEQLIDGELDSLLP